MTKQIAGMVLVFAFFISAAMSCCKEESLCIENINEDCACVAVYEPVCGCNGKTYGNSCEAQCSGIDDYTEGTCE